MSKDDEALKPQGAATEETAALELARSMNKWVADVSHDLKTPLSIIQGWADTLLECALTPEESRHAVQIIRYEAARGIRLVQRMLDITRIEAGRTLDLAHAPTHMPTLAQEVIESLRPLAPAQTFCLDADEEVPTVAADADRVQQVLMNLIHNAVAHSGATAEVVIGVRWVDGDGVHVTVKDHGVGMTEAQVAGLFARYARVSGTNGKHGNGLGLHISKAIVEAHGGRIWAESTPGQGSRFHFVLPANPPAGR